MVELVDFFVCEIPGGLQALRDLCESGDREGVQRLAHQLKGASAGYGFEEVGLAAANVEQPLKGEASLDDVRDQIDEQLQANGVAAKDAPCVADAMVDELTDDDFDVLLSGEITDDFFTKFVSAMEECGAINS
mgnify:CR=1 FL=1